MYRTLGIGVLVVSVALFFAARNINGDDDIVRIRIWHQKIGPEREMFNELIDTYNRTHSDHKIEALYKENEEMRSLYIVAAMGGQGPEIVFGPSDNIGILAITDTIQPVDTLFESSFYERFTPDGLVKWQDQTWAVADQVGNHLTLVYNKALIQNPPETMTDLINVGKELTRDTDGNGQVDQYALAWQYQEPFFFVPFLTGFGGWVMDDDGNPTLDNQQTVDAIQFILDLRDKYEIIPKEIDYDTAELLFKDGKTAMIINGPWAWSGYTDAGIDFGLAKIPFVDQTGLWAEPMVSAKCYSINANVGPDKMPFVKQILEYFTSTELQVRMARELGTIPVDKLALDSEELRDLPLLQGSIDQYEHGRPMPTNPRLRQIWDGMRGPYQLVMNGAIRAEQGARMMQEQSERLIKDTFL